MDSVLELLVAAQIPDPVIDDTVGVISDLMLSQLYGDLVAAGEVSEAEALRVGATIEDLDIRDIDEMITRTEDPEILAVYDLLICGSRNHMRGFTNQLSAQGESYEAQFISSEHLEGILGSERETCAE